MYRNELGFFCVLLYIEYLTDLRIKFQVASPFDEYVKH